MIAIILAAGEGRRLRPHTLDKPKCLVPLGGKSLLEWQMEALRRAGIDRITVVTGYRAEAIDALGFRTLYNPSFASSNMVSSLMCAASLLDGSEDVLVAYADLVYESRIPRALATCTASVATTVDLSWLRLWEQRFEDVLGNAETLELGSRGEIRRLGSRPHSLQEVQGQYMGLIRVSAEYAPRLVRFYEDLRASSGGASVANMYMTDLLQHLIEAGWTIQSVPVEGGWLELDTARDLETYTRLRAQGHLDPLCRLGE